MPGRSYSGPFLPLEQDQIEAERRLRQHVHTLADEIGERNVWQYAALLEAADYLDRNFRELGYSTASQDYQVQGKTVRNLEAELKGTTRPAEILVVGAHYDSVMGCPGANDNGSGVAALLEIARLLAGKSLARTVRFVAFVNEEPPFFQTGAMGSLVYASRCRQRNERIVSMLSLETIGYYTDAKSSQQYPFPFSLFYPNTGNFIGFVGNLGSRSFLHRVIRSFREKARFPSEGVAAPGGMMGIGWSDHWAFWQQRYPAVMVTDTALFRYPYYHTAEDTPDRVVYDRLARVTVGLARVTEDLAGGSVKSEK
jgi:Zn-dependent M28 family amino/carboxypeptidase